MWNWFLNFCSELSWPDVLLGAGLFALMFTLSIAEVAFILVKLPADYFAPQPAGLPIRRRRWLFAIGKNALGLAHIVIGILLSFPGIPGQGALTILLGVMLMDLPGVRRLEHWLVRRPTVRRGIDRIRARFRKPALILDEEVRPAAPNSLPVKE